MVRVEEGVLRDRVAMTLRRMLPPRLLCATLVVVWAACLAMPAHADLLIVPQRIVFEPRDRAAALTLVNNGTEPTTYRIAWKQLRQKPDGSYEDLQTPGPGDHFADGLIRYSPRQVTLDPGEPQVIRLLVRRPADLATGEYRSHLTFTAEPTVVGQAAANSKSVGVQIAIVYGISLPIIVRQGDLTATATLAATLKRTPTGYDVSAVIKREGTKSIFGDIIVEYVPPRGKPVTLQELQGVSVLPPNNERIVALSTTIPSDLHIAGGQLRVVYRAPSEEGGAEFAAQSFQPPG